MNIQNQINVDANRLIAELANQIGDLTREVLTLKLIIEEQDRLLVAEQNKNKK